MAFTDYVDLRTAVIEQVGDHDIADKFDRLTQLSEAEMNRRLRTRHQITSTALTVASGVATLPSDVLEPIGLFMASGAEILARAPKSFERLTNKDHSYVISGAQLETQDGEYTFEYYAKIPTLTVSMTTSNWVLENYPALYLYAVSVEAAKSMKDVQMVQDLMALKEIEYATAIGGDAAERYGSARVRVVGATP